MALPQFTTTPDSKLFFNKAGTGSKPILLFHGFGQDHSVFNTYIEVLGSNYTLYTFDIYFHGQSEWLQNHPVKKNQWEKILTQFLREQNIERFSLLAFSIGVKFALASVEACPARIDNLFLIAPDGISKNFWYTLATSTWPLRVLFKSLIQKPQRFYSIVQLAKRMLLVDEATLRFAESQMDTTEKRLRVYQTWVGFRKLQFNMQELVRLINNHEVRTIIILGKLDKIIRPNDITGWAGRLKHSKVEMIDARHSGMVKEAARIIGKFS